MRVVVTHPARTEEDGTEVPESKAAYRVGRILDHTDLLTGATTPRETVAKILLAQAQEEFPGHEVAIEHLHVAERHSETNEVTRHEWKDEPPEAEAQVAEAGAEHSQELSTDQSQEVSP